MRRATRLLAPLFVALLCGLACQSALAYWSGSGEAGSGSAAAATFEPVGAPTAVEVGEGEVTVSWEAGTLSNGVAVGGYVIQRYENEALEAIGPGCAGTITELTCTETEVPEGEWQYTVTPVIGTDWRGPESPKSGGVATAAFEPAAARPQFGALAAPSAGEETAPESETPVAPGEATTTPETAPPSGGGASSSEGPTTPADESAPTASLALVEPIGAYLSDGNLYFDGLASGSFTLSDALTGGSGSASVTYPEIDSSGWDHAAETVTTPSGGPYDSSSFSWTAGSGSPGTYEVSGEDALGATATTDLTFVDDQSPPSGGSVTYADGTVANLSVPIATADGTDAGSGIAAEAGTLERDEATLNPTSETCGAFAGTFATTVTLVEGDDTSVTGGHCYQYRYVASDNVGNLTTYTSANVVEVP